MLFVNLRADLEAKRRLYSQYGASYSMLRTLLTDGTSANVLYRTQEWLASRLGKVAGLPPHVLNKWFNGCVIGIGARFEPGFVLIHPIGVVINASVRGGRDVWLESSVVIGDNRGGSPVLGQGVFVGSGAKVIGPVTVGDGARIGANAVVLKDVPVGATAVGIPAQIKLPKA
ncbi:MAG: serine acetyltransferase [Burkholderiales bacterium]|jgi:serine O-acetyltransferase|nr:MAG: serine acetyltransferase [Burkholderiales bacterium]